MALGILVARERESDVADRADLEQQHVTVGEELPIAEQEIGGFMDLDSIKAGVDPQIRIQVVG